MTVMSEHPTYPDGQCTRYAADNWSQPVGPEWGDARMWLNSAQLAGYVVTETPDAGDLAVWGANMGGTAAAGHVAIVVQAAPLTVDESNWTYPLRYDRRVVSAESAAGIIGYVRPTLAAAPEDTPMTPDERVDVARALTRLTYAAAAHRAPETQEAEDQLVSRAAGDPAHGFDFMVRDLLTSPEFARDLAHDAAQEPAS